MASKELHHKDPYTVYILDKHGNKIIVGSPVISEPPNKYCRVTNLYVNPETGRLVVEYDDTIINYL